MSVVKAFSVAHGDMFYIKHNSDNFSVIDCHLSQDNRTAIVSELQQESRGVGVTRFISTHPDDDHICGLVYLDDQLAIRNFYCVDNAATKEDETDDFRRYCSLRDSHKTFHLSQGCKRRWMNRGDETRKGAGINILWPNTSNPLFIEALDEAAAGLSPNNISPIIKYSVNEGVRIIWMGDLDTDFMEAISSDIELPAVDIVFAPHHGRDSGGIPDVMLNQLDPKLIVIGEAPADYLYYYEGYNTITQNSAGNIAFDNEGDWTHVYVSEPEYFPDFLVDRAMPYSLDHGFYVGSLVVGIASA